jgi:hypothetical protein
MVSRRVFIGSVASGLLAAPVGHDLMEVGGSAAASLPDDMWFWLEKTEAEEKACP